MNHADQMAQKTSMFKASMEKFIATLEASQDATRAPKDGGWNPAQIGWHVAASNVLLAGALKGDVPMAKPLDGGFHEDADVLQKIPAKVETFPQLQPPADTAKSNALQQLRASIEPMVGALSSITEDRAKGHYVQMPMGSMTMYQFADFSVGHVTRHQNQLDRAVRP